MQEQDRQMMLVCTCAQVSIAVIKRGQCRCLRYTWGFKNYQNHEFIMYNKFTTQLKRDKKC